MNAVVSALTSREKAIRAARRLASAVIHEDGTYQVGCYSLAPPAIRALLHSTAGCSRLHGAWPRIRGFGLRIRSTDGFYWTWVPVPCATLLRFVTPALDAGTGGTPTAYHLEVVEDPQGYTFILG